MTEDELRDKYLSGQCHEFAMALSKLMGWPIIWLEDKNGCYGHSACKHPSGNYWDIRGLITEAELIEPFPGCTLHDPKSDIEFATDIINQRWPRL